MQARGLSVHGGCQLKAHAVFDCVGKKPPPGTPQPSFDEPLVQGSPLAKRSPSGDAIFVDDVEEGVGRLELHLASVKLLETSDEEDTTTGDYYVRSRRPSHDAGGGSFFDIELFPDRVGAVAAGPRERGRGDGVFTRQRRRDGRRRDATSDRVEQPRRCASSSLVRGTCLRPKEEDLTGGPTRSIKVGSRTLMSGGGSVWKASRPRCASSSSTRRAIVSWARTASACSICSRSRPISVHWIT